MSFIYSLLDVEYYTYLNNEVYYYNAASSVSCKHRIASLVAKWLSSICAQIPVWMICK